MNECKYLEWKDRLDQYSRAVQRFNKYQSEWQSATMKLANLKNVEVVDKEVHDLKVNQAIELIELLENKKVQAMRDVKFIQKSPKLLAGIDYNYAKSVVEKFELLSERESDLVAEITALENLLNGLAQKPEDARVQLGNEGYPDWELHLKSVKQLACFKHFIVELLNDNKEMLKEINRNKKLLEVEE